MKFLRELEKLCTSYYYKKGLHGDLDWFLDMARDKVLDSLQAYDVSKGPLVPFIYSLIRNRGSSVSRRENRKIPESQLRSHTPDHSEGQDNLERGGLDARASREMVADTMSFHSFMVRSESVGLRLFAEGLETQMSVKEGLMTPLAQVYSWLYMKGEL